MFREFWRKSHDSDTVSLYKKEGYVPLFIRSEDIIDIRCDKNRQSVKFVCLFHTKDDAIETMKFLFNLEEIDGKPGTALSTLLDRTSY